MSLKTMLHYNLPRLRIPTCGLLFLEFDTFTSESKISTSNTNHNSSSFIHLNSIMPNIGDNVTTSSGTTGTVTDTSSSGGSSYVSSGSGGSYVSNNDITVNR
ncbi:hypothetical protein NA56DRAFT_314848 [Hyaloscypha hepaticicola]|uniref:Uncharacterized protein n=1 Tax=Hyaloscypha hepaticicola TaxID=2082293 RepID=A0A2J6PQL7_9HELO|nr:hypothetical protein NA56DRAFT_314848 [Hyaloscypha hepaticicola]